MGEKDQKRTREDLLKELLCDEIESIRSGEIYEHGYPESRLIPQDHYKLCEKSFIENVVYDISEEISSLLKEICEVKNQQEGIE